MDSNWLVYAVTAGLASNVFNYLNRWILINDDDLVYSWFFEISRIAIFLFILFFDFELIISLKSFLEIISLGVVEILSILLFMKMHANTHLSISTIIVRLRLVLVPLFAFLFLKENLRPNEYLGIFVIFIGLLSISIPQKLTLDKGVSFSYQFAIIASILSIFMKSASKYASTSVVITGMSLPSVIFLPLITKKFIFRLKKFLSKNLIYKMIASIFNAIAMYFYLYSMKIGSVSKVTAIYQGMMIFSILAGIIFLKEHKNAYLKIVAGIITFFGIVLLYK